MPHVMHNVKREGGGLVVMNIQIQIHGVAFCDNETVNVFVFIFILFHGE